MRSHVTWIGVSPAWITTLPKGPQNPKNSAAARTRVTPRAARGEDIRAPVLAGIAQGQGLKQGTEKARDGSIPGLNA